MKTFMPVDRSPASIVIQARDNDLLRGLFVARVMTLDHLTVIYFDGRRPAAKKRVAALKKAGLVAERPRRPYEPAVHFLTRAGLRYLQDEGHLHRYPTLDVAVHERRLRVSDLTLKHELMVTDVVTAMIEAARATPNLTIAEWTTWPRACQFTLTDARGVAVDWKPDGLIRLHARDADGIVEHSLFLEVDRSTESTDVVGAKAAAYRDYYRSGGFAKDCGGRPEDFAEFPFRVAIVCQTAERRNNIIERMLLLTPPIMTQVVVTTLAEAVTDPIGPIWIQPKDYLSTTVGTPFEVVVRGGRYRTRPDRERYVEREITKRALLT
jgi:hypothetical protein